MARFSKKEIAKIVDSLNTKAAAAIELARVNALNWGDSASANRFSKMGKIVGPALTAIEAGLNELELTGNTQKAAVKAVLLGSTALSVMLVVPAAGTLSGAAILFASSLAATKVATSIVSDLFESANGRFGLFFENRIDVRYEVTDRNIMGTADADLIRGGQANDTIFGGDDGDALHGYAGQDTIFGGGDDKRDKLYGGKGKDFLDGGFGKNKLYGGSGSDKLVTRNANTELYGGSGEDWLISAKANVSLQSLKYFSVENISLKGAINSGIVAYNAEGDIFGNRIDGNGLGNSLDGAGGKDSISGHAGKDEILGGSGKDKLFGGSEADTLYGGKDKDVLSGGAGRDSLHGGKNGDQLEGGRKSDTLFGGSGNDTLFGGDGGDTIFGGAGQDTVFGGDGNDTLELRAGSDWAKGGAGNDTFVFAGGSGHTALGGGGDDTFVLIEGADHSIAGGAGYDVVDLKQVDLELLETDQRWTIDAIAVDDLLLSETAFLDSDEYLVDVLLSGNHVLDIQVGDWTDGMALLGGGIIVLEEGASLTINFSTEPLIGHDENFFDTSNIFDGSMAVAGDALDETGNEGSYSITSYSGSQLAEGTSGSYYHSNGISAEFRTPTGPLLKSWFSETYSIRLEEEHGGGLIFQQSETDGGTHAQGMPAIDFGLFDDPVYWSFGNSDVRFTNDVIVGLSHNLQTNGFNDWNITVHTDGLGFSAELVAIDLF